MRGKHAKWLKVAKSRGITKAAYYQRVSNRTNWSPKKAATTPLMRTTGHHRPWSEEEEEYLADKWGEIQIRAMALRLGRTNKAIVEKADKLGLGKALDNLDGITLSYLAKELGYHYETPFRWRDNHNLPSKVKTMSIKNKVNYIPFDDFWEWAEQNKDLVSFAKLERYALGPEPDWVDKKRVEDKRKGHYDPSIIKHRWTQDDLKKLERMIFEFKYTYEDLSNEFNRSKPAIRRKLYDLGIKARPIRKKRVVGG